MDKETDREFLMQFFEYKHLPPKLQFVSQPFGEIAQQMMNSLPRNPERTTMLRKLLEAKDCAVRCALTMAILFMVSCTGALRGGTIGAPAASVKSNVVTIQYAVNIPDNDVVQQLRTRWPYGQAIDPSNAQRQYDYTVQYGGVSNVYFGQLAPPPGLYTVGIVVAPIAAATKLNFTSEDWGVCPVGAECTWLAHFEYVPSLKKQEDL